MQYATIMQIDINASSIAFDRRIYSEPEYIIYSIISGSGGDTRDTELFVIVYQSWDTDGTVTEIVRKHCTMNGTPNRLTIHLYHSMYALNHGQAYYTKTFEYPEDEIIGPPPAW